MANEAHVRIDEGIKRGKRQRVDRHPRAALTGQYVSPFSPTQKAAIIEDWLISIQAGQSTTQVAERYGITARAIQYWLLSDERAEQARAHLIAGELARTLDDLRAPTETVEDSPLRLARAREEFRAWAWIAERREARLYGPKQEVTHLGPPPVLIINAPIAAPLLPDSSHDVIEHDPK